MSLLSVPAGPEGIARARLVATGLMVFVAFLTAVDTIVVRHVAAEIHPFEIAFFRSLFGLLFVAPWMLRRRFFQSRFAGRHLVRAALKLFSITAFFIAIAHAPLADVTAIGFTQPLFVTLGAWLILGEGVNRLRIVAVAMGFAGVTIILQPGAPSHFDTYLLYAVAGAIGTAIIQLMLKVLARHDRTESLVAYNLVFMVPLSLGPAIWFWTTPSWTMLGFLALQGLLGALAMTSVSRAMALADASYLSPMEFLRLPIVAVLAFLLFGEVSDLVTWIGAGVIFAASLLLTRSGGGTRPRVQSVLDGA